MKLLGVETVSEQTAFISPDDGVPRDSGSKDDGGVTVEVTPPDPPKNGKKVHIVEIVDEGRWSRWSGVENYKQ